MAVEALVPQAEFVLDEAASEALAMALSNPAEPNVALRSLMSSKAPWADVPEGMSRR